VPLWLGPFPTRRSSDLLAVVALRGVAARGVFLAVALRGVLAVVASLAVFLVAFCGDFPRLRVPSSVPACSSLVSRVWCSFSWPRSEEHTSELQSREHLV